MPPSASDIPLADIPLDNFLVRESVPVIEPRGFRDYDVRWRYPEEINLLSVKRLGFGAFLRERAPTTSGTATHRHRTGLSRLFRRHPASPRTRTCQCRHGSPRHRTLAFPDRVLCTKRP